jgi:hypothetical protein
LNCNETVPFWLSWAFGDIRVGIGNIMNERIFMQWLDPNPMSVSIISIATGWGSTGIWQFSNFEGMSLSLEYFNPRRINKTIINLLLRGILTLD